MRAAIYARVSSAAQRDAHTIDSQLHVLRPFVVRQGWTLVDTYVDDGRSAKTGKLEKRDGFARLLRDAEARRFDALAVLDIDRLTRTDDMIERAAILGPFQRAGIQIVTPSGGQFDLTSLLGGLYVDLQARFAAEENRKRAERVKAGKARAIAEGRKPAGPTPYGLAYDRATGSWSIDKDAAAIVREIYRRVIAGEACRAIAHDLTVREVPPPRDRWHGHNVWQIVRKRHPAGEWTADKRIRAVVKVPAIVDEATWQAAQEALLRHGKRGLAKTLHHYLLESIATCGQCGSPIAIRSARDGRNGYRHPGAYVCRARKLESGCDAEIVRCDDIDARVWSTIERVLNGPDLVAAIAKRLAAREGNRRDWERDARGYRARLSRLAETEATILERYRRGLVSSAGLDRELAAIARDREALEIQLATATAGAVRSVPQESAADVAARLRTLASSCSPEARQRVVRAIVPRGGATLDGGRVRLTLEIEAPGKEIALVSRAGCRTEHEDTRGIIRFRRVA
jgi:site-specific DNA recombinase